MMRRAAPVLASGRFPERQRMPVAGLAHSNSSIPTAGKILTGIAAVGFLSGLIIGFENAVAVVAVAGAVAMAAFMRSPGLGLLGVGLLCTIDVPMRVYVFTTPLLRYNTFNYALVVLGLLMLPDLLRLRDIQSKWLAAFVVVLAIQLIPSSNRYLGVVTVLEVVSGFALVGCFMRGGWDRDVLQWMAIVNATASAACVLVYFLSPPSEDILHGNALSQIPIAGLVSIALAAAVPGVVRRWSVIALLATANVVLVFLTNSRGGLTVAAVLAVYIVMRSPRVRWRLYVVALFACLLTWGASTFTDEYSGMVDKWYRLVDPDLDVSQATSRRSDIAILGWSIFLENPLGAGTGSFTDYSGGVLELQEAVAAHSGWVKTMAENGIPGLVFLVGYILSFARKPDRPGFQGARGLGLLVILVLSIALVFSEFQSRSIWLLAAGATALLHRTGSLLSSDAPSTTAVRRRAF